VAIGERPRGGGGPVRQRGGWACGEARSQRGARADADEGLGFGFRLERAQEFVVGVPIGRCLGDRRGGRGTLRCTGSGGRLRFAVCPWWEAVREKQQRAGAGAGGGAGRCCPAPTTAPATARPGTVEHVRWEKVQRVRNMPRPEARSTRRRTARRRPRRCSRPPRAHRRQQPPGNGHHREVGHLATWNVRRGELSEPAIGIPIRRSSRGSDRSL